MTVERCIRILAGTLVLASALLGYFVHHYWLFFTMFIGANLLQSGITKWCLMEDILKKLGVGGSCCGSSATRDSKPSCGCGR